MFKEISKSWVTLVMKTRYLIFLFFQWKNPQVDICQKSAKMYSFSIGWQSGPLSPETDILAGRKKSNNKFYLTTFSRQGQLNFRGLSLQAPLPLDFPYSYRFDSLSHCAFLGHLAKAKQIRTHGTYILDAQK